MSGEIGDDVTAYFVQSEQVPTACALGVLVDRDTSVKVAGGYILQLLPGAPEETITALEEGIQRAGAVTPMLEAGMTPEDILGQVCGTLGVVFMETAYRTRGSVFTELSCKKSGTDCNTADAEGAFPAAGCAESGIGGADQPASGG